MSSAGWPMWSWPSPPSSSRWRYSSVPRARTSRPPAFLPPKTSRCARIRRRSKRTRQFRSRKKGRETVPKGKTRRPKPREKIPLGTWPERRRRSSPPPRARGELGRAPETTSSSTSERTSSSMAFDLHRSMTTER